MTVAATFAATIVDEWARSGLRHAVICPGSRSTPMALALDADGRFAVHVRLDERSAGFLALGIGLATGVPAVVMVTSGTAAAELHPAVLEASYARVPLLVCTADRPPELHDVGAPQTVDQQHLYGRAVRWFCAPGVPDEAVSPAWRSMASRAVAEATGAPPGPVHLDLAFREPLVGDPATLPPGRADGSPWHQPVGAERAPRSADLDRVADELQVERGIIVAGGPGPEASAMAALASATGWPVVADPRSGVRVPAAPTVASFDSLLRHRPFATDHHPEVVVRFGQPPLSKVLGAWLNEGGAHQVVIDPHGAWWDADRQAAVVAAGDPTGWALGLAERLGPARDDRWSGAWATAEAVAQRAIDEVLGAIGELTEPFVARSLVAALPERSSLVVAASMPARDVEWFAAPRRGLRVLGNRGANGIDGVVSTAVGVALATAGPTAALLGDLAFLHDANALLGLAADQPDLALVVIDNGGGGIFSFLPQSEVLGVDRFERLFGTPQDVDLPTLAGAHGLPTVEAHGIDGWHAAMEVVQRVSGPRLVVVHTDRAANVAAHAALHDGVARALG